jgi:hypothetical protein
MIDVYVLVKEEDSIRVVKKDTFLEMLKDAMEKALGEVKAVTVGEKSKRVKLDGDVVEKLKYFRERMILTKGLVKMTCSLLIRGN